MRWKSKSANANDNAFFHPGPWRRWFAWYPVRIGEYKVWLQQIIRRKKAFSFDDYTYVFTYPDAETLSWLSDHDVSSHCPGCDCHMNLTHGTACKKDE